MKSIVLRASTAGEGLVPELVEMETPTPGSGEIVVKMEASGLCGTDLEKMRGEYTASMPQVGHEAAGVISAVGRGVAGLREGDRVFPHHHVPCHECFYCLHGNETACEMYRGSNIYPGGFSEFFRVPAWNVSRGGVLRLPTNFGFEELSLIEPVGCCIRALEKCRVNPDDFVLVVGAGPVGILHSILLRSKHAKVAISDVSEARLRFAEKTEVECVVNALKRDVASEIKALTAGRGADTVIVASGSHGAILQALGSVRTGGRVCLFGVPAKGSALDYDLSDIYSAEVSLIPSYGATDSDTAAALNLIEANGERFRPIITHRFPVEEFEKAVETATSGEGMKVIVTH